MSGAPDESPQDAPTPGSPGRPSRGSLLGPLGGSCLVFFAATAILAVHAPAFRPLEPNFSGYNDQIGYLTTARWLADEGELRSHLVYPAYADNPRWRLYMPGHYVALALAYKAFGNEPLAWRLPCLLSYALSGILVFLIGRKLYGERAGYLAALLFLFFPPNPAFAFTVMSESTFVAAALLAFALFVHVPAPARFYLGPLLLVVPFLFRETGALLALPMCFLALAGPARRGRLHFAGCLLLSVAALIPVYAWQSASGKQSDHSWIATGTFNYRDAVAARNPPEVSLGEWAGALWQNLADNVVRIAERLREVAFEHSEPLLLLAVILLNGAVLVAAIRRRREDPFALGAGLMGLAALLILFVVHRAHAHVAIRHVLFTFPFLALVLSERIVALLPAARARIGAAGTGVALALAAALLLLASLRWTRLRAVEDEDRFSESTELLEELDHDDDTLFVYPIQFGLEYVLKRYPLRWSFTPDNEETLKLLAEHYEIGTVIIKWSELIHVDPAFMGSLGLSRKKTFQRFDKQWVVFQRRR